MKDTSFNNLHYFKRGINTSEERITDPNIAKNDQNRQLYEVWFEENRERIFINTRLSNYHDTLKILQEGWKIVSTETTRKSARIKGFILYMRCRISLFTDDFIKYERQMTELQLLEREYEFTEITTFYLSLKLIEARKIPSRFTHKQVMKYIQKSKRVSSKIEDANERFFFDIDMSIKMVSYVLTKGMRDLALWIAKDLVRKIDLWQGTKKSRWLLSASIPFIRARVLSLLAMAYYHRGEYKEAFQTIEPIYDKSSHSFLIDGDYSLLFSLHNIMGVFLAEIGRIKEARIHLLEAKELAVKIGSASQQIKVKINNSHLLILNGDYHEAETVLQEIREDPLFLKAISRNRVNLGLVMSLQGRSAYHLGNFEVAGYYYAETYRIFIKADYKESGNFLLLIIWLLDLALVKPEAFKEAFKESGFADIQTENLLQDFFTIGQVQQSTLAKAVWLYYKAKLAIYKANIGTALDYLERAKQELESEPSLYLHFMVICYTLIVIFSFDTILQKKFEPKELLSQLKTIINHQESPKFLIPYHGIKGWYYQKIGDREKLSAEIEAIKSLDSQGNNLFLKLLNGDRGIIQHLLCGIISIDSFPVPKQQPSPIGSMLKEISPELTETHTFSSPFIQKLDTEVQILWMLSQTNQELPVSTIQVKLSEVFNRTPSTVSKALQRLEAQEYVNIRSLSIPSEGKRGRTPFKFISLTKKAFNELSAVNQFFDFRKTIK